MNIKKHLAASTHMIVDPIVRGTVTVTDKVASAYQSKVKIAEVLMEERKAEKTKAKADKTAEKMAKEIQDNLESDDKETSVSRVKEAWKILRTGKSTGQENLDQVIEG